MSGRLTARPATRRPVRRAVVAGALVMVLIAVGLTVWLVSRGGPEPSAATSRWGFALAPCERPPDAGDVGPGPGRAPSGVTSLRSGATLENADVRELRIEGSDVTVRNVAVAGRVLVSGDNVTLSRISAQGLSVSSARRVRLTESRITGSTEDAVHITSDRGRTAGQIMLDHNYIAEPRVGDTAHFDGTQIRGADGIVITCSTYDAGEYRKGYNAAIYLEDANGGTRDVVIADNHLRGFGFSVMLAARDLAITGNSADGDVRWGPCMIGDGFSLADVRQRENTVQGRAEDLCGTSAGRTERGSPPLNDTPVIHRSSPGIIRPGSLWLRPARLTSG